MAFIKHKIHQPCPVCGGDHQAVKYAPWVIEDDPVKLYGAASGIPGTQRLVICRECGLIFESPRYDARTIVEGYMASKEAGHDSQYHMRVHSFLRTLIKLRRFLPSSGAKVLDIGTAGGAFLEAAQQFGYVAYGMEPSADLVARGKARGLKIEQGTIEKHSFALGEFDLICLWDVIEHLPEPKSALLEIKKLLKPGGLLLINYPDIGTWQAKLAGRKFWWILSVHLQHFTRSSISDICFRTGFQVIHLQRYWQTLEFGYLERMAIHYKLPLAAIITRFTPSIIQRIAIPYYASQTTALAIRQEKL